jgi:hypothetical protein
MDWLKKDLEQIKKIKKDYQDKIKKKPAVIDLKKWHKTRKLPKSNELF